MLTAVHPVEPDVSFDPINIAALGMDRAIAQSRRSADFVQQLGLRLLISYDPRPILVQEHLSRNNRNLKSSGQNNMSINV
jgi:hypothetical protein